MDKELLKEKGTKATAIAAALIILIIIALNIYSFEDTALPGSFLTNQTPGQEIPEEKNCIEMPEKVVMEGENISGCKVAIYDEEKTPVGTGTKIEENKIFFDSSDCLTKDQWIEVNCNTHEYLERIKDFAQSSYENGKITLKEIVKLPEEEQEETEELESSHPCNGNMTFETRYDSYRCFEKRKEFKNCTYYFLKKGRELEKQSSMLIDSQAVGFYSTALNCAREIEGMPEARVKVESYRNEYEEWGKGFHVTASDIDELITELNSTRFN